MMNALSVAAPNLAKVHFTSMFANYEMDRNELKSLVTLKSLTFVGPLVLSTPVMIPLIAPIASRLQSLTIEGCINKMISFAALSSLTHLTTLTLIYGGADDVTDAYRWCDKFEKYTMLHHITLCDQYSDESVDRWLTILCHLPRTTAHHYIHVACIERQQSWIKHADMDASHVRVVDNASLFHNIRYGRPRGSPYRSASGYPTVHDSQPSQVITLHHENMCGDVR
jgi:hypothetical protein